MKQKFVADDGSEFDSAEMCLAYEKLVEASKNKTFHEKVESLFYGCTSWVSDHPDDNSYPVLRINSKKDMAKFKTNLVQALPVLDEYLKAALNEPSHDF